MFEQIWRWFRLRWPYDQLRHVLLDEEIRGGASFAYTLGMAIFTCFSVQLATGVVQLFYYVPSVDHAYDSVSYLRTEVPFGWLVHNLHFWGANLMVVALALHMIRVYVWGAYKTQLTWLIGVGLLITTMALTFTGAPLIWDQKGFWAGEVGSSITGTVPVVGGIMKTILRGGEGMGQLALSRFFAIHIAILVPFLVLLIGAHIAAFRKTGVGGPWDERKRNQTAPFWPDQAFRDTVVATGVLFCLITLAVFSPPVFSGAADPSNTSYIPKPEWNFLFLYQALKYFKGPLEPVGTAGVPTLLIALLLLLPFIDRGQERNPARRPIAMLCLVIYAGFVIAMTIIGYLSPGYAQIPAPAKQPKAGPSQQAATAARPGEKLLDSLGCTGCHRVNGKGGVIGPALTAETLKKRDRNWLTEQITNPKSHYPDSPMPSYGNLPKAQIREIVDFLISIGSASGSQAQDPGGQDSQQKASVSQVPAESESLAMGTGRAAHIIGSAENGAVLFRERCADCHGRDAKGGLPNPGSAEGKVPSLNPLAPDLASPDPRVFVGTIDRIIQHGALPAGPHPGLSMPPFGDSNALTQQELANIEAYIMSLNQMDRTAIVNPGMMPLPFFFLVLFLFVVVALILGGLWSRRFRRCD